MNKVFLFLIALFAQFISSSASCADVLSLEQLARKTVFNYESNDFSKHQEETLQLKRIKNKKKVYRLVYFDYGYNATLPFDSSDFPNLQELTIVSCHHALPKEILGFKKLQVLTVRQFVNSDICSNNAEIELTSDFFNLKHLKIVDFRNCNVRYIPDQISELKELRVFMINGPPIGNMDDNDNKVLYEWNWYLGGIENRDALGLRTLPLSILTLDKLAVFVVDGAEELPEWDFLKHIKPDALFTYSENEVHASLLMSNSLLTWYLKSKRERGKMAGLCDGEHSWKLNNLEITGSVSKNQPNGIWEFRIDNILRQRREYSNDSIIYSLFDTNELLINSWTANYNELTEMKIQRYDNGDVYCTAHFHDDELVGTAKMVYPDGKLMLVVEPNGTTSSSMSFDTDGNLNRSLSTETINGVRYSTEYYYRVNGEILSTQYLINGMYVDSLNIPMPTYIFDSIGQLTELIEFDSQGNKTVRYYYEYTRGVMVKRTIQEFYESGQLSSEESYSIDESKLGWSNHLYKDGIWRTWDTNGVLTSLIEYKLGESLENPKSE